jgi:CheY-like chemotaxis protein
MANERTILLVEDDADDVELTRRALQDSIFANRIVVAPDGRQALDYLFAEGAHAGRDPADQPHLILLDLSLPVIDGLDVLGHIRADPRTNHIPVVILTASSADDDMIRSYNLGANSFVRKSHHFQQFIAAIRQVELYWLAVNAPRPR